MHGRARSPATPASAGTPTGRPAPSKDIWPSTAFTFHVDGTSPANGFLRVVPGSHLWATPAPYRNINGVEVPSTARATGGRTATAPPFPMPLGFEKIRGEVAVYAERGRRGRRLRRSCVKTDTLVATITHRPTQEAGSGDRPG